MLPRFLVPYQPRPEPAFSSGDARSPALVERWLDLLSDRMARRDRYTGRLMAAVYADMVGYSRLFRLDSPGTVARLRKLRRLLGPAIRHHHGRLAQTAGDALLFTFDSIAGSVKFAVAMQCAFAIENDAWPDDRQMRMRVGVDLGDVVTDGRDFHGDGVIMAARLQEICPPGGVCVSRAVYDRGGDRLGLPFEPIGAVTLKNIDQPVEAFVLRLPKQARTGTLRLVV
jgi:adenylate cyclase